MNEVDNYINGFSGEAKEKLNTMRAIIRELAPDASERICMRMPTYDLHGRWLVHFAGFKNHIGFFPQADGVAAFLDKLDGFKTSKGGIQFPLGEPLPVDLIQEIVKYKVEAQAAKAKKEKK